MSGRRRKSLSIFRPSLSSLTPIRDTPEDTKPAVNLKKKLRPSSIFSSSPTDPSSPLSADLESGSSPIIRPRTLQKQARPSSIFGSLRSLNSTHDEDENLIRTASQHTIAEEGLTPIDLDQMTVLHHGEVQTAGSMFRRRGQYLVLTNTHLMRFKNQAKAAEVFPSIPSSLGRANSIKHGRMSSAGSNPDGYYHADPHAAIALHNFVAAYKLDDGRPYFTIELAHYDEHTNHASTMSMQLNDPRDSELWLTSIRAALIKSRLIESMPFSRKAIEHAARALEYESDYEPSQFRMFTVVQRATKSGARSSSDDLGKLMSNIFYLVIGAHKVHLVPLPKSTKLGSTTSLSDFSGTSHGLMSLSSVYIQTVDDAFQLGFRIPFKPQSCLYLASSSANDIVLCVRQAAEFLRPTWLEQPFVWSVPDNLDDALLPVPPADGEDNECFDRTLTAYCVSYRLDPSNIRYTVNYDCEDAPEFELCEPANSRRYSAVELLAILRALRYNESFHSVSFRGILFDALHGIRDRNGSEHFLWTTRSGQSISLPRLDRTPVMVQELQCLVLKSKRLRRLDFTDCLSRKSRDLDHAKDDGTGICEALFPLCLLQFTNVDWIILNGVALTEIDIEYLYAAAIQRLCHFRAIELARCGLDGNTMRLCLQGLSHQGDTLESLMLAGNSAAMTPDFLAKNFNQFRHLRKLDISKSQVEAGQDPLIGVETLMRWKLELLTISGTTLNTRTVESISAYLMTRQSDTLRELRLEQCQLSGDDVATLFESMMTDRDHPRELHLFVSENRLEKGHSKLASAIRRSVTSTHLTMQMLEYSNERNFRELLSAVSSNKSLQYLDISRASLPYDAGNATCEELRLMLDKNSTLQELNISGEQAHLEAVTLGKGLPDALRGLEVNTALKVFHIEHQVLGLPGASAIASALEKNSSLIELHCDDNEINLQAFTTLVNAIKKNKHILFLPAMDRDRAWSRGKVDREVSTMLQTTISRSPPITKKTSTVKKLTGGRGFSSRIVEKQAPLPGYTEQDVQAAVDSLDQTWVGEITRLQGYLRRNYCLAHGLPIDEDASAVSPAVSRPVTALGLAAALQDASLNRTPTMELERQLGGVGGGERQVTQRRLTMDDIDLYARGSLGINLDGDGEGFDEKSLKIGGNSEMTGRPEGEGGLVMGEVKA